MGYLSAMPDASADDAAEAAVLVRREAFGRRLRELRTRMKRSQAEIAEVAGLTRPFYVGVEGGRRNVSLDKVFALADALGVDVGELFHDLNGSIADPKPGTM